MKAVETHKWWASIQSSSHFVSAEAWHSLAASFPSVGNTPGQRVDFSTVNVKAERNAVNVQTDGLNVWECPWECAQMCAFKSKCIFWGGSVVCAVCVCWSSQAGGHVWSCQVCMCKSISVCMCSASHCCTDICRLHYVEIKGDTLPEICWLTLPAASLLLNGP